MGKVSGERPLTRPSYQQIAAAEGSTYNKVRRRALKDGTAHWPVKCTDGRITPGSNRDRAERIALVRELRAAGCTFREMAKRTGFSTETIQRYLEGDNGAATRRMRRKK